MIRIILMYFVCITIYSESCFGQKSNTITGKLSNEKGENIFFGSLIVYDVTKDSLIISFGNSDENGVYKISFEGENSSDYLITASALGYDVKTFRLTSPNNQKIFKHNFILNTKAIDLNEVSVVDKKTSIISNKDTATYNVKSFVDGSERTVQDILSKLPGIRVSESGNITVKGKPIDKITIEGEDFFNKNYKLISKNMSADVLESIQTIDNYNNNPLMQDVEVSGKMVINLVIKANIKKSNFGNASLELGLKSIYKSQSDIFSLLNKLKLCFIGNINNIGYDPLSDVETNTSKNNNFSVIPENGYAAKPLINAYQVTNTIVDAQRYKFNSSKLAALNLNYKITKNLNLKSFIYWYKDEQRSLSSTNYQYLTRNDSISFDESLTTSYLPQKKTSQIILDYQPLNKLTIQYNVSLKDKKSNDNLNINSTNPFLSEKINSLLRESSVNFQQNFNTILKFKERNVFIVNASNDIFNAPQYYSNNSIRYATFFNVNKSYNLLTESIINKLKDYSLEVRWKGSNKNSTYTIGLGVLKRINQIRPDIYLHSDSLKETYKPAGINNNIVLSKISNLVDGSYSTQQKFIKFTWKGALSYNKLNITRDSILSLNNSLLFNQTSGIRFDIDSKQDISVIYTSLQKLSDINDLVNNNVLIDYKSFRKGLSTVVKTSSQTLLLNYSNTNWNKLFTLQTNFIFSRTKNPFIKRIDASNLIIFQTLTPFIGTNDEWNFSFQIDKFLNKLYSNVRTSFNLSLEDQRNYIESEFISYNRIRNTEFELRLVSALDSPFNIELGSSFTESRLLNTEESNPIYVRLLKPRFILKFRPNQIWFANVVLENINYYNSYSQYNTSFLDSQIKFSPLKKKYSLELNIRNLFQSNYIAFNQIDNYVNIRELIYLRPRYISLNVNFSF